MESVAKAMGKNVLREIEFEAFKNAVPQLKGKVNTFSLYCAIFAISTALILPSLNRYETVVPSKTSKAAEQATIIPFVFSL